MRQTKLFGKTLREAPKDEQSVNAKLLQQAGYVEKLMAGVYSYLPLGLKVIRKLENIIRDELPKLGAEEVFLPALQPKELWDQTGRWELYANERVMYQFADHSGRFLGLGPTHEEIITPLAKRDVMSYRDLPFSLYQFQTKFRSELRAKSGLLRGREFLMKDLYSFHATAEDLEKYYQDTIKAYMAIYNRVGIGRETVLTFASGGSFTKYSHEFQTINEAGEDTIYVCAQCNIAINDEIITDQPNCPQCGATRDKLAEKRAIEVGNIFQLKQKYSEPFGLNFKDQDGTDKAVLMGCYGIGLGRLMATIIEVHHDDDGLIWPESVAPYQVHLVRLGDESAVAVAADKVYEQLQQAGWEVLYDDREVSAGVKLKDADLLGLPLRLVISQKTLAAGKVEWKLRAGTESHQSADALTAVKQALA